MIEVKPDGFDPESEYKLFIDGKLIEQVNIKSIRHRRSRDSALRGNYHIRLLDETARDAFFSQYICDLPESMYEFQFYNPIEWPNELSMWCMADDGLFTARWVTMRKGAEDGTEERTENLEIDINFGYGPDPIWDWPSSFSIQEYVREFIRQIDIVLVSKLWSRLSTILWRDITSINLNILATDNNSTIGEQISARLKALVECHKRAVSILTASDENESVSITLDFPNELKVYCEQYLVYFVQFLKDLGVEATSELKHDAGKVLFSVTPTDKDEALDKIRTALEVYLCLPSGKFAVAGNDPIEVQRLSANILHLQSQLMLAQAMIQHKDAAIQLQQATIQHQQFLLAENVITQSVVDITPKKVEDREEFLGGAVALTQIEKSGVRINLAEIYRRLRDLFNK
jgi:hypothetical protein